MTSLPIASGHASRKRRPLIMALEPRIMFDGAAVADVAHATQDAVADMVVAATLPDTPPAIEVRAADQAQNQGRKEVAFIDSAVADIPTLVASLRAGVEVVTIEAGQDALAVMTEWAASHSGYDAIHLLSHGESAHLNLSGNDIGAADLADATTRAELATLGQALKPDGDILLYGCDVASGQAGQDFTVALADITGADVAASDDVTGAAYLGGDWELEVTSGSVESTTALTQAGTESYGHTLATFDFSTITNNSPTSIAQTNAGESRTATVTSTSALGVSTSVDLPGAPFKTGGLTGTVSELDSNPLVVTFNGAVNVTSLDVIVAFIPDALVGGTPAPVTMRATPSGGTGSAVDFAFADIQTTYTLTMSTNWTGITSISITRVDNGDSGSHKVCSGVDNIVFSATASGPAITSATYDASTNVLSVTGANLTNGGSIDETKLTLTGQGGATYTLTETGAITASSTTGFSITLNATDQLNVEGLLNKTGTTAVSGATYNLAGAADWHGTGNADTTGNAVTVSNVQTPTITSATYDASTGVMTFTGTNMVKASGANNDITVSKLRVGAGSPSYTLTSSDVEITSATSFSVTLNGTDRTAVDAILNKNGNDDSTGVGYIGQGQDDWNTVITNGDITDLITPVTVSNVAPRITSATYDASTNVLSVTGSGLTNGGSIDETKLTLTGQGGATYTLTETGAITASSTTGFSITLNATDAMNVEGLLNKAGTTAVDSTTFNLAGAADWHGTGNADLTGNGVTVSSVQTPTVSSATYDASNGSLVLTGTNMVKADGATNDITANKITLTGEGGATYTLTDTANVEITSATSATLTLSANDKAALNQIFNKTGTASTGGTTYNVAAADDWNTVITNGDISDTTGNAVTVSNPDTPTITSATYNAGTGALVVTGTGFLKLSGATNDIDVSKLTLTGEGGATYTLTTSSVEITSGTAFTVTLNATDLAGINQILNKAGTSSTGATTYNLAGAEDWAAGAAAAVTVADLTGNGITVSSPTTPTITSTAYDATAGTLVLTGTGFLKLNGATNDIVANKFTFTGEGGATYTLTDTANIEITSGTAATLTLSATDKAAVNLMLNKAGTSSTGGTTYNVAAAEDWAAGADAAVNVVDATTGVTVSNLVTPTVTSAAYDYSTNTLVVTGTGFVRSSGAANDVNLTKLTLTGQGGATYTLAASTDVEVDSGTQFTVTLTGADIYNVEALLNANGTSSAGGTTYNIAAAASFLRGDNAATGDATSGVTVSNWAAPVITSTTFDWNTGALVLTGTNFVNVSGATNDVVASKFTFTGEGGTYTLTDSSNVEITSATAATITLSATDLLNVRGLLNKNGTQSSGAVTYNLAAADDWMAGSPSATDIADATTGSTVSNVATPTITSATYDSTSGVLTVTGTNLFKKVGATNDIDVQKLTFTGQGGGTYTIAGGTADVEVTSATSFTMTLTGADKTGVDALLDQIGTTSSGGTTYNLAGADAWVAAQDSGTNIADATNAITVSINPTVTSATYDANAGTLVVTGANIQANGGGMDIDLSKLTLTGEGGSTYTLTTSNVERDSVTQFTVTVNATDKAALNQILNKTGTASTGGTTFNIAAADDWCTNVTAGDTSDATNGVTVSNPDTPTITSATYNAGTGALVVTGTGFLKLSGATNDIDVSKLTITGEGGATYTLTTSSVEITSGTAFTVTLNATDLAGINQILNKADTSATGGTTYNLAGAEDWASGAAAAVNVADLTGNGITVSNPTTPTITSTTYDASTGVLVLTGTGFLKLDGATNDIVANKLAFRGEGNATYALTDTANVEITSGTTATLTLSATDKAAVNLILNKAGTTSTSGTTYVMAAAEDWAAGAEAAVNVLDATTPVTVSNVAAPVITSATYDYTTNTMVVTGTGFVSKSGATNDIDLSKLTLTGQGGATYTLASTTNVEITSDTSFSVTLSGADIHNVEALLNKDGTSSVGGTTYNLAGAEDWAVGADAAVTVADLTGNGITVSNWAIPTITSATYDWSNGQLVLTGTNFVNITGATNDIVANKLTLTGEGGGTYTLTDTANVEITSATTATLTLSATDKLNVHGLLNKNGTTSGGGTTYNVAAADDWMAGSPSASDIADATGNGATVSNVGTPTITSATFNSDTGVLTVTGTNLFKKVGAANDIDLSMLTFTGGNNATFTLTTATDVEITSATSFTATLSGTDLTNVAALMNALGTQSGTGTTYNLAAADNWLTAAEAAVDIADATGNAITVSINPAITSATYNANTGALVVTGTNIQAFGGANNDIDVSKLTLTGEGGATYTLTTTSVERDSATQFTVTLNATDKAAVNQILNKTGTSSTGGTTFNIAAAADWSGAVSGAADATNAVTVSNPDTPTITSATYDAGTGTFVVTGTGLLKKSGAANDVDVSKFTITGEGGETYTLTTSSVEITNGTSFTITLSPTDKAALNLILNKDGTSSTGTGTYNLAAAEDWAAGAEAAVNVADLTGNGITVSNVAAPTVTSATYDYGTGTLTVTGTGLLKRGGAANDIDLTKLTLTGGTGTTHTLTSTDVEVTSGTSFTVTLNNADKTAINLLLNKNGTASNGGTTYNLAAAGSWNRGSAVAAADLTGNGVTVSSVPAPVVAPPAAPPPPPAPPPVVEAPKPAPPKDSGPVAPLVTVVRDNTPAPTTFQAPAAPVVTQTQAPAAPTLAPTGAQTVQTIPATLTAPSAQAFQVAVAVRAAGGGDALVVNAPVRDSVIAEGTRIAVTVPSEAFAHTKADATVTLTATRDTGAALPAWMAFNPQTGTFEGTPPPGFKGEVVVRVVARDQDGREAVQTFKIVVGTAGQGNIAPGQRGGEGQGQGQGEGQGQPQGGEGPGQPQGVPGQTGDSGPMDGVKQANAKPIGRPSLTEQLHALSFKGGVARQIALFEAVKRGGKAA
ncbi:conserved protein of unknown function [Magnetospirillum gryphiswaldense MSR-1 v2]|uniref:Dystroglycan-type cadherin-like domain-containing protein n=1 Tax=Magnetospirillum gryphiswaldense (strain DSM 6361 / JCM 21280 / NBRC 15271 / MSR-1) TaxID=431944 RepID=V6F8Z2_MAGGM|nr:DUF4347 domain-containing protein [Magnetospirillum gryphiswaldense]CDL01236.1 conserved protein of unknown function [Magnetospirillum gryphiswaldense MSR-1 v2]